MRQRDDWRLPALPQALNIAGIGKPQAGFRTLDEIMGQTKPSTPKSNKPILPPWPAVEGFRSIDNFDIRGLLARLTISTRTRRWRILSDREMEYIDLAARKFRESPYAIQSPCDPIFISNRTHNFSMRFADTGGDEIGETWRERSTNCIKQIDRDFPTVKEALLAFNGRLFAAGGAIFRRLNTLRNTSSDIDIFMIDPDIESSVISEIEKQHKATELLLDAITFMSDLWMHTYSKETPQDEYHVLVSRGEFVTTLYLCSQGTDSKIQFIHRVYPNIGSVLGGFDLTPCMVGFDGYSILALEIGAWSALGCINIIDISRRSTSFEYRLQKYAQYCHTIFPGLPNEITPAQCLDWKTPEEAFDAVRTIIKLNGYRVCNNSERIDETFVVPNKVAKPNESAKTHFLRELMEFCTDRGFHIDTATLNLTPIGTADVERGELFDLIRKSLFKSGYLVADDNYLQCVDFSRGVDNEGLLHQVNKILHLKRLDINVGGGYFNGGSFNIRVPRDVESYELVDMSDYSTWFIPEMDPNFVAPSDYHDTKVDPHYAVVNNTSLLITNNLGGVTSLAIFKSPGTEIPVESFDGSPHRGPKAPYRLSMEAMTDRVINVKNRQDIRNQLVKSFAEVFIGDIEHVLEYYRSLVENRDLYHDVRSAGYDFLFRRSPLDVRNSIINMQTIPDWVTFDREIAQKVSIVVNNLQGVKWITSNPGRQWTSSINPIVADPRDWYGEYYRPYLINRPELVFTLKLFRKRRDNYFGIMGRYVFGYLMDFVLWADSMHV